MAALRSFLFWTWLTITSISMFPLAVLAWLVTMPFDPRRVAIHRLACAWAWLYMEANPIWKFSVDGR